MRYQHTSAPLPLYSLTLYTLLFAKLVWAMLVSVMLLSSDAAWANSDASGGCHKTKQLGPEGYRKAAQLTFLVQQQLDSANAKVVILGRKGSHAPDKRFKKRVGLWNYTHGGFAYKDDHTGKWTVIHMLNICNDKSAIFKESLMKFSLSDVLVYKTAIGIPSPSLQDALYPLLKDTAFVKAMYGGSTYSSISNPYNTTFQNSNEYLLDILVAGMARLNGQSIRSREASKAYFKQSGLAARFVPEEVRVRFHERLGSSLGLGPGNASIRDHGLLERSDGRVDMASVGSIIVLLENTGFLQSKTEVSLKNNAKAADTKVIDVK